MADLTISSRMQILPPLRGQTAPVQRKTNDAGTNETVRAATLTSVPQPGSTAVRTDVNVVNSDGLSLYDSVSAAVSGDTGSRPGSLNIKA